MFIMEMGGVGHLGVEGCYKRNPVRCRGFYRGGEEGFAVLLGHLRKDGFDKRGVIPTGFKVF